MTMMIMMMMRLADQYWLGGQSDRVGGDGCRSELHDAAAADDDTYSDLEAPVNCEAIK